MVVENFYFRKNGTLALFYRIMNEKKRIMIYNDISVAIET